MTSIWRSCQLQAQPAAADRYIRIGRHYRDDYRHYHRSGWRRICRTDHSYGLLAPCPQSVNSSTLSVLPYMWVVDHRRWVTGNHADGSACFEALAHSHSASRHRRMIDNEL